jgi:hypothetical protein
MTEPHHHDLTETRFRELLAEAGLPEPDECAHLQRTLVFLWHATKAIVVIDLDEVPVEPEPLAGFDARLLADDILAGPGPLMGGRLHDGFAEAG